MLYQKELICRHRVDVLVVGGGPAGVAAAVTCARQGKRVFLVEARGAFGGLGTVGLVPEWMPFTDGVHFLAGGIGEEICRTLFPDADNSRRCYTVPVEPLKRLYDDLVTAAGVEFCFFTQLVDVITDGHGRATAAVLSSKSGLYTVEANVFVDCTGDGDFCAMAGAAFSMGDDEGLCMAATLCSLWSGVDFQRVNWTDDRALEQALADGMFTQPDRHLPGMRTVDIARGVAGGNIGHCFGVDATDETSLTRAMVQARKQLTEFERYYKTYLTGYENMVLTVTADMLGVRESRRITGEYVLTLADFCRRADFADEIGRYNYPVDSHVRTTDAAEYARFSREMAKLSMGEGESYGIPYRCLIPAGLTNVLVAGRCVSTDRAVQASLRVVPGCYITGQAAGMAAAMTQDDVRGVSMTGLRNNLRKIGAYLPHRGE